MFSTELRTPRPRGAKMSRRLPRDTISVCRRRVGLASEAGSRLPPLHAYANTRNSTRAATPYRGAAHRHTKISWSCGTPPRGPCGKDDSRQRLHCGCGGGPEGVAIGEGQFDTPSGPLCFFLGSEKEELAQQPTKMLAASALHATQNLPHQSVREVYYSLNLPPSVRSPPLADP